MKNNFKQFVADRDRRHRFQRRLISLLCVLSVLVSASVSMMLTMPGMTASYDPALSNGVTEVLTDNPSHNGWIDYFGISVDANGNVSYDTEFVGSVWTDKSTFTEYTTSKGQTISAGTGNMLGVLSAIGSSMAITGRIYSPTDVMLILDLSSSMYNGSSKNTTTVNNMVKAVNNSIATLLSMNDYNRVGVTVYYGGSNVDVQAKASHSYVLLPLNRYIAASNGSYLTMNTSSNKLTSVRVTSGVRTESGSAVGGTTGHSIPDVAGTYIQAGLLQALNQFMSVPESDLSVSIHGQEVDRQPIYILMSDGEPTAGTVNFTDKNANAQFGNNSVSYRSDDETDFVTQLTAAYAKEQVGTHYRKEALFYTLALINTEYSLNVMDPENNSTTNIDTYWNNFVAADSSMTLKAKVFNTWSTWPNLKTITLTLNKVTLGDGTTFPSSVDQRLYVDEYFHTNTSGLENAFEMIISDIYIKSIYTPVQSTINRENTSGEVSFVDQIGEYMEVKDIKGILMGGNLHTGASFAKTIMNGESVLGTLGNATAFGMAFWTNVMEQIGLNKVFDMIGPNGEEFGRDVPAVAATEQLIISAYNAGQLYYFSDTDFSNYIGWYATSDNTYLGFWDGSDGGVVPEGATQRIKTYFFQSSISADDNQTMNTDMMYSTVWVKEDITTGVQTVVFSTPASLLPTLKYFVKLDVDGNLDSIHLGSLNEDTVFNADGSIKVRPIRLVYEVGLQSDINAKTLLDKVDATYLEQNTNQETGEVYFYSNEWERDQSTGYFTSNTYSYFRPSRFNDRYYYLEDSYIYYKDANGNFQPCTATDYPELSHEYELYTLHPLYSRNGTSISTGQYSMPLGDYAMDAAQKDSQGKWYVPVGTDHSLKHNEVSRFDRLKEASADGSIPANVTGTLNIRNAPTIDRTQNSTGTYLLAATLGNNGRIAVAPSGQTLMKVLLDTDGVTPYITDRDENFTFLVHEGQLLTDAEGSPIDYNDGAAVQAALGDRKVTLITLQVKAGNSESARQMLYDLTEYVWQDGAWHPKASETPPWECQYLQYYTVVELDSLNRYDFKDIAGTAGAYTFQYGVYPEGETDHTIYASNQFVTWKVNLTKIDAYQTANRLPGAVFGIYTSVQADGLTQAPEGYEAAVLTAEYYGSTWYLMDILITDENGTLAWDGLRQEQYLVVELKAPNGYYEPVVQNATIVEREAAPDLRNLDVTISNIPGTELPETGGSTNLPYIIIGSGMMIAAAALMFVYRSKRKEDIA